MANRLVRVVAAVIEREQRYLITQRREEAALPGLWEFPGGKVETGETDAEALCREVLYRVGVAVEVAELLSDREHAYDGYGVHLSLYRCSLAPAAEPQALRVQQVRWVGSAEFGDYRFPPADQATMDALLGVKRWP